MRNGLGKLCLVLYLGLVLLPILWLVVVSLQPEAGIQSLLDGAMPPATLAHYQQLLGDPSWAEAYLTALSYVAVNTTLSLAVALPAAYAFSRFSFLGDRPLFFWLLAGRAVPTAVFVLPFVNLSTAVGLFDTPFAVALAHCLFTVPIAVWILAGAMSTVPREVDETAYLDGYGFTRFFLTVFLPLIRPGIAVAAFFCFLFSWIELLLARSLTAVEATPVTVLLARAVAAPEPDLGVVAAAGVLMLLPGLVLVWFVRHAIARGFALGRI